MGKLPKLGKGQSHGSGAEGNVLSISSPKANGHRDSRGSEDAGALRKMLKRAGSMQSLLSLGSRRSQRSGSSGGFGGARLPSTANTIAGVAACIILSWVGSVSVCLMLVSLRYTGPVVDLARERYVLAAADRVGSEAAQVFGAADAARQAVDYAVQRQLYFEPEDYDDLSLALEPVFAAMKPLRAVGDMVRVQTNLGWETVTVRAKRPGTGKIDIQFKDGEYMRAVMPRILRNAEGQAVKEAQEAPATTALPPPWPPRPSQYTGPPIAAPHMAPVPVSSTGAVPQKLAGYKGGIAPSPVRAGHPLTAEEPTPRETQDALAGAIMEGCSVELREQTGLPPPSSSGRQHMTPAAKAPAARLKQQLQQLISARPIVVPKVGRSASMPRNSAPVPEPLVGYGLIGSAVKVDPKNGRMHGST